MERLRRSRDVFYPVSGEKLWSARSDFTSIVISYIEAVAEDRLHHRVRLISGR